MPSQPDPARLCIFGDSHLASVRQCLNDGLEKFEGAEVEFWGAFGPLMRELHMRGDRIVPSDEAREMVLRINGHDRPELAAEDFDYFLFYGSRVRIHEFAAPYLHHRRQGGFISAGALTASARDWMHSTRFYRFARDFAAKRPGRVFFAPSSLPAAGVRAQRYPEWPGCLEATAEDRARMWEALCAAAAEDGVTLIPQPEDTVVSGCLTDSQYALPNAHTLKDDTHKSPAFAARYIADIKREMKLDAARLS